MPHKPENDGVWANPEQVLKPSREDILIRLIEDCVEERYFTCWTSEALIAVYEQVPQDVSHLRCLLQAAQASLLEYLLFLELFANEIFDELEIRGASYDPRLRKHPQAELQSRVADAIEHRMEFEGIPAEEAPTLAKMDREQYSHEYAVSPINDFLSRFNQPANDVPSKYPSDQLKVLKNRLIEVRREMMHRLNDLKNLREKESDRIWEEEADEAERASMRLFEEQLEQSSKNFRREQDFKKLHPPSPYQKPEQPIKPPLRPR